MSPKLPRVTATDSYVPCNAMVGFTCGSTALIGSFAHSTKPGLVVVPAHAGKTLGLGLVKKLLSDAGLTVEEFERLL